MDLVRHLGIVHGIHHHGHAVMVLGGAAQHRGTTNVDVLDGVVEGGVGPRDRLLEGVQVDDYQVEGLDPVLPDGGFVRGIAAQIQEAAVDFRVQRLHPAIEHFREAGVGAQIGDGQTAFAQGTGGAAGGNQFDAGLGQDLGEG